MLRELSWATFRLAAWLEVKAATWSVRSAWMRSAAKALKLMALRDTKFAVLSAFTCTEVSAMAVAVPKEATCTVVSAATWPVAKEAICAALSALS